LASGPKVVGTPEPTNFI